MLGFVFLDNSYKHIHLLSSIFSKIILHKFLNRNTTAWLHQIYSVHSVSVVFGMFTA